MMFAWTNSYNKQVKFKCVVGAYINQTGSVMISGEVGSWVRKHTGSADTETKDTIDSYIANAHMYYTQLCSDKATMETVMLNKRKQSQLLGVLFAEYEILTTEQASFIRDQMKRPQHVFASSDSLWAFYNYVTNALQLSHPKTWMEDQRILHYFISTIGNFQQCSTPAQVVQPINTVNEVIETETDPNQINLLDAIAEAEAEADLEAEQIDEDIRYAADEDVEVPFDIDEDDDAVLGSLLVPIEKPDTHEDVMEISPENSEDIFPQDETVVYTDPIGNVFQAPVVIDTIELNENTKMAVVIEENSNNSFDDDFDLNFDENESEDNNISDFF
jgi:hypothetical protein